MCANLVHSDRVSWHQFRQIVEWGLTLISCPEENVRLSYGIYEEFSRRLSVYNMNLGYPGIVSYASCCRDISLRWSKVLGTKMRHKWFTKNIIYHFCTVQLCNPTNEYTSNVHYSSHVLLIPEVIAIQLHEYERRKL